MYTIWWLCISFDDYVYHVMTMYIIWWLCIPFDDYVCHVMTMYTMWWLCIPFDDYVYHVMTMYIIWWLCISFYDYAYRLDDYVYRYGWQKEISEKITKGKFMVYLKNLHKQLICLLYQYFIIVSPHIPMLTTQMDSTTALNDLYNVSI